MLDCQNYQQGKAGTSNQVLLPGARLNLELTIEVNKVIPDFLHSNGDQDLIPCPEEGLIVLTTALLSI